METINAKKLKTKLYKPYEVLLLLLLGLLVFTTEFATADFSTLKFNFVSVLFIFFAILFMLGRYIGTMWRFRLLTDKDLSWLQAFHIHTLSEFKLAITNSSYWWLKFSHFFLTNRRYRWRS